MISKEIGGHRHGALIWPSGSRMARGTAFWERRLEKVEGGAAATAAVAARNKTAPHDVPWTAVQPVIETVRDQG